MEKKTVGLIATIGTTLLCACPGLCLCLWGVMGLSGTPIDVTNFDGQTTSEPMGTGVAIALLCVSLIAIAIPVVVGFFTLRKKDDDADGFVDAAPFDPADNDPLPPAS